MILTKSSPYSPQLEEAHAQARETSQDFSFLRKNTKIRIPSEQLLFKKIFHSFKTPEGNGTPLQCSCLANPMDGGAWKAPVHGVARSRTWLSDFTFIFHLHALAKEIASHSSVLAWRIPGTAEPGGLPSMGSHRVRHDWSDLACMYALERERQSTPLFLPGDSWEQRSLMGYRLWGRTESDTTEAT